MLTAGMGLEPYTQQEMLYINPSSYFPFIKKLSLMFLLEDFQRTLANSLHFLAKYYGLPNWTILVLFSQKYSFYLCKDWTILNRLSITLVNYCCYRQCDAIRCEQLENSHFSKSYNWSNDCIIILKPVSSISCRLLKGSVLNIVWCNQMGNFFCGDVVSYSFNKSSRDEDSILYQIYKSKYFRIIILMILIHYNIIRKFLLTLQKQ